MRRLLPLLASLALLTGLVACQPAPLGPWPSASNTGPTGPLTPSGSIVTSRDGQVIEDLDITGQVRVQHDDVTIRNVRIRSAGGNAIYILNQQRLLVEDCELDGQGVNPEAAIALHNYVMRRCEVRGFGEGPRINGRTVLVDNYIHGFANFVAQGHHQDCIQQTSGEWVVIRHNVCIIEPDGANGAIYLSTSEGAHIAIEDNLVGGGNWAIEVDPDRYRDVSVKRNHVTTTIPFHERGGYFGAIRAPSAVVEGNVWADGPNKGQPVG